MNQRRQASLLDHAIALHRAGKLAEAEPAYREWLATHPDDSGALALLGQLAVQNGQPAQGLPVIDRALALRPGDADALAYRGQALKALGRFAEAADCYRAALRGKPGDPILLFNLGNALAEAGSLEDAVASFRRALKRQPRHLEALNNLGLALRRLGNTQEAIAAFGAAIAIAPDSAGLRFNLATALANQGDPHGAIASLLVALRMESGRVETWHLMGQLLMAVGHPQQALDAYNSALAIADSAVLRTDVATALARCNRRELAVPQLRRATVLAPTDPQSWTNLGTLLRDVGDDAAAVRALDEALRLSPGYPPARYHLGVAHLLAGRLAEGWPLYEARMLAMTGNEGRFAAPIWRGEPMPGETLLLHAEQGLGDTLQFSRWIALVKPASGARVILEVQAPLKRLLADLPGVDQLLAYGEALPAFDRHCPLPSLPTAFATTLETIPSPVPYLAAEPDRIATWQDRLAALPGRKVGLVWAGNAGYEHDDLRSIPPAALAALAGVPDVSFVSLQKERGLGPDGTPPSPIAFDPTAELTDVAETAALMGALDLVISADTAMVHLAGALGVPVWLLNRHDTDWRWFRDRPDDSPFYPTLRQFRQNPQLDWGEVIGRVRDALS